MIIYSIMNIVSFVLLAILIICTIPPSMKGRGYKVIIKQTLDGWLWTLYKNDEQIKRGKAWRKKKALFDAKWVAANYEEDLKKEKSLPSPETIEL
jgi:hypothetical protein